MIEKCIPKPYQIHKKTKNPQIVSLKISIKGENKNQNGKDQDQQDEILPRVGGLLCSVSGVSIKRHKRPETARLLVWNSGENKGEGGEENGIGISGN